MQTLEEKIGQLLGVGFDGLQAPDYLLEWLAQGRVGAVILFARNVESPEQLARLTASLHAAAKHPILIGIDQEGGTVARLRQGFTESPGAMALSAAASGNAARVERVSRVLAQELRALGINWDYAPVVDLAYNAQNPSVGTRSFGIDPERVSELVASAVRGFQQGGVAACAKHFPGLGNTPIDTHVALPTLDTPLDTLIERDLMPYRAVIDAGVASIMTTHTIYSTLDTAAPATLSPIVVKRLLRDELGFDGVVTTDCMEMKAIADNFSPGESAVMAILGDVDLVLFSHTRAMQEAAFAAVLNAVRSGRIPESRIDKALERIAAMKARFPIDAPPDLSRIRHPDHLATVQEAARAGVVLLRGSLPVDLPENTVLVEFVSILESGVVERGEPTGMGRLMSQAFPQVKCMTLKADLNPLALQAVLAQVATSDLLLLGTRNAHLLPEQLVQAKGLMQAVDRTIHLCLRNPYDALALPGAETVLCSCGDSTPSLEAIIDALRGEFVPTGRLPVPLETIG